MNIINIRNFLLIGIFISILCIGLKAQEDDGTVDYDETSLGNVKTDDHETSDGALEAANEEEIVYDMETDQEVTEQINVETTTVEILTVTDGSTSEMTTLLEDESSGEATEIVDITIPVLLQCQKDAFECDAKCLSNSKRCDTVIDCSDESDEKDCDSPSVVDVTTTAPIGTF